MKSVYFIPNFKFESSLIPTDSVSSPKSFPIDFLYAKNHINNLILVDSNKLNDSIEDSITKIVNHNPKYVFVSTTANYLFWRCPPLNVNFISLYANALKRINNSIKIILVGPHSAVEPWYLMDITETDYIHIGEIDNICLNSFNSEPIVKSNNLDELMPLSYHLADLSGYEPHCWNMEASFWIQSNLKGLYSLIEASRGCIHKCSYCFRFCFRDKLRLKRINSLENEIKTLSKIGVRYIFFIDETFGYPWHHYKKVIRLCKKYNLKYGMQTRPDIWDKDKIKSLKSTGCIYSELGIESNEIYFLRKLDKFGNNQKALQCVGIFEKEIRFVNKNILDLSNPYYCETNDEIQLDNEGNKPIPIIPYPTTEIAKTLFRRFQEYIKNFTDWEKTEILYAAYLIQNGIKTEPILRCELIKDTIKKVIKHYEKKQSPISVSRYDSNFKN